MGRFILGWLGLVAPRLTIVLVVIFGDYIGRTYENTLRAFVGFPPLAADHAGPRQGNPIEWIGQSAEQLRAGDTRSLTRGQVAP